VKIVLVTPAWRRYDVTRVALAQRRHLCDVLVGRGHDATCLVVADDENLDVAEEYGFPTLPRRNSPLGAKFNAGIHWACKILEADVVSVVGSDDWCHEDLFDRLPDPHPGPPDLAAFDGAVSWGDEPEIVTGRRIAIVNLATGKLVRCHASGRSGVIPWLIPRAALEPSGFRPVRDEQQIGLDFSLMSGLGMQPNLVFHDPHDFARVDFKSDVNLNAYEPVTAVLSDGPEEDAWSLLAQHYPADLVSQAQDLMAVAA
jgi:hypothetical protein